MCRCLFLTLKLYARFPSWPWQYCHYFNFLAWKLYCALACPCHKKNANEDVPQKNVCDVTRILSPSVLVHYCPHAFLYNIVVVTYHITNRLLRFTLFDNVLRFIQRRTGWCTCVCVETYTICSGAVVCIWQVWLCSLSFPLCNALCFYIWLSLYGQLNKIKSLQV